MPHEVVEQWNDWNPVDQSRWPGRLAEPYSAEEIEAMKVFHAEWGWVIEHTPNRFPSSPSCRSCLRGSAFETLRGWHCRCSKSEGGCQKTRRSDAGRRALVQRVIPVRGVAKAVLPTSFWARWRARAGERRAVVRCPLGRSPAGDRRAVRMRGGGVREDVVLSGGSVLVGERLSGRL